MLQEHWTNEREALIAERSALVAERESLLAQRAALGQFGEAAPGPDTQAGSAQRKRGGLGGRRNGAADGRERNETETDLRPRHPASVGQVPSADLADLPAAERRPGDDVPGAATARLPAVEPDHVEDPAPDEHTGAEAQDGSRTGWSRRTLGWLLAPAEEPERDDDAARSEEDQGVPAPEEHGLPPRRLRPDVEPAAARSETAPASPGSDLPSRLAAANAAATARALASESYDSPAAGDTDDGVAQRRRVSVRAMIKLLVVLVLAGAIAALLRSYVIAPYYIPSASMEPTLHGCKGCNNDHVLADKLSYKMHDLHRGDVVVFHRPTAWLVEEKVLIKRVIGLPGDTLTARNGVVYIDGLALAEPYVDKECQSGTSVFTPITVPDGQAFVMGDNRCDSSDSRRFGAIADSDVIGRAAVIIWPLGRLHWL
ncbi:MAG: signal peptidase I [Actinomycetota bacterium]|nr:signal peptidase I [Actinomycetota bacterium]